MPCTDVVSFQFLIPLCIGWQVLFGIGAVHGFLRRDARHSSRGWQLFASVVVILGVLAIESLLQLLLAAVFHGDVTLVTNFFGYVRLLFCSLSDSLFIALLLAISGGYWYEDMFSSWACVLVIAQLVVFPTPIMYHSITRETLGPYKAKVIGIPCVYFVSDVVCRVCCATVCEWSAGRSIYNSIHTCTSLPTHTYLILILCYDGCTHVALYHATTHPHRWFSGRWWPSRQQLVRILLLLTGHSHHGSVSALPCLW